MNSIAFISQSGNVMKSSLAIATAVESVKNDLSVAIADLDIEHRTVQKWLEQRTEAQIEPVFQTYCPSSAVDALDCFDGESLQIIDAPSRATSATLTISKNVDLVILPTPPSKKDIDLTLHTISQLASRGVPLTKLALVFSRVGSLAEFNSALDYTALAFSCDDRPKLLSSPVWERVGYRSAINDGYAITETSFPTLNENAKTVVYQLLATLLK